MHEPVLNRAASVVSLIGMPGSGKTSAGRWLAKHLAVRCVDLDLAIERRAGCSITELFSRFGEAEFRRLETAELASVVKEGPMVLATGGGTVLNPANRAVLRSETISVYLFAEVSLLWSRLKHSSNRPLLAGTDPYTTLCEMFERRHPLYVEAATIVMESADRRPAQATARSIWHKLADAGWVVPGTPMSSRATEIE